MSNSTAELFEHPEYGSLALGGSVPKVDPRTLRFNSILFRDLPPPPDRIDNSQVVGSWGVLGNDTYGDCVVACYVHLLMGIAARLGGSFSIPLNEIVRFYFERTGGVDSGLVILDFLKYALKNYWQGKRILAFASVNPDDVNEMAQAIFLTGFVTRGVGLPKTAQSQVGQLFDYVNSPGNGVGSWGWHCMLGAAYDLPGQIAKDITWGLVQPITFRWLNAYQTEMYAIITEDTPGVDQSRIEAGLQAISDGDYFGPEPGPVPPPTPPPPPAPKTTSMRMSVEPAGGAVGVKLADFTVALLDQNGQLATFDNTTQVRAQVYEGTFAYANVQTMKAVSGILYFKGIVANNPHVGLQWEFTAPGLATIRSAKFDVTAVPVPTEGPTFNMIVNGSTATVNITPVKLPPLGEAKSFSAGFIYPTGKKQLVTVPLSPASIFRRLGFLIRGK